MTPEERKKHSEQILTEKGISFFAGLPMTDPADKVKLRSLDEICSRAIAALLSTQAAIELNDNNPDGAERFSKLMDYFDVRKVLNEKEERVMSGKASEQDMIDVVWEYESYWALVWALGLVDDITDASQICDCPTAISFVSQVDSYRDFKEKCSLRSADEILDMLDLYYRYHWAVVQKEHVDPNCSTGDLNGEVVFERRRGLEWLLYDAPDWHNIPMNT